MSPSELMIRTIHWVCSCCGEMARTPRKPNSCVMCGSGEKYEEFAEVALPSD